MNATLIKCQQRLTAVVEKVHAKNVIGTHFGGPAKPDVWIGNGNDCWLPVPREGKSIAQQNDKAR